jgi:glycosyltransferase involved in cell wall biosynthesis
VLCDTVDRLDGVIAQAMLPTEVLVIDGGSTDDTPAVAAELAGKYPGMHLRVLQRARPQARLGFGTLVRYGLAYSTSRYCALVAADGSDPLDLLPKLVAELRAGNQLAICSRYVESSGVGIEARFRVYQHVYRAAVKTLLSTTITDSTNGFRVFDRKYVQALGLSSNRFSVCPEITFKVLLSGGKVAFVPGQPQTRPGQVAPKFALPHEILGYAHVLGRAGLHRLGISWF